MGSRKEKREGISSLPSWIREPGPIQVAVLLAALASVIYANSLGNGFVFDDSLLISENVEIQNLERLPQIIEWAGRRPVALPADQGITHRPVRTAALALQYSLFGKTPTGYRLVNILLHILNGTLVFVIVKALLGRGLPALLAAGLFVVHPVQTESVAYVSGQRDVLFTAFYLLGFWSYLRFRGTERIGYLVTCGISYVLGLLTKEMAITLPLLCVVYDLLRDLPGRGHGVAPPLLQALRDGMRAVLARSKWLYLLMGGLLGLCLYYFVFIANPSHRRALYGGGLGPTLLTSGRIVVHYLKLLIFPFTLNADYSFDAFPVSRSLADPHALLALLILTAIGYGLLRLLRIDRMAAFGGFWFFITLLPVSQIIPHHEMVAEHFLYLPSVGVCLVIAWLVGQGLAVRRYAAAISLAFAVGLLLLGVRTVMRNRDWKDNLALWTATVRTAPRSVRARTNLAGSLKAKERFEEALIHYQAANEILPDSPRGYIGMGDVYRLMGRFDLAVERFERALELHSASIAARVGLTRTYADMGLQDKALEVSRQVPEVQLREDRSYRKMGDMYRGAGLYAPAVEAYRKALELSPYDFRLYSSLGMAYAALGKHEEAAAAFRQALKFNPQWATAHLNLGNYFLHKGRLPEAIRSFQETLRLAPNDAAAHNNLGVAYSRMGRLDEALAEFQRALALEPNSSEFRKNVALARSQPPEPSLAELERAAREQPKSAKVHYDLGSAYGNRGDLARAAREFQTALQLDPSNSLIHYALGLLHAQRGEAALARQAWERALKLDPLFTLAQERLAELRGAGGSGLRR
jgi:tetratricopeptide (TPR) repeat protein